MATQDLVGKNNSAHNTDNSFSKDNNKKMAVTKHTSSVELLEETYDGIEWNPVQGKCDNADSQLGKFNFNEPSPRKGPHDVSQRGLRSWYPTMHISKY